MIIGDRPRLNAIIVNFSTQSCIFFRPTGLTTGELTVTLSMTGDEQDPDGCTVSIDGGSPKSIMAGSDAVQLVSCLLKNGPDHIAKLKKELTSWLEEKEYKSLAQMRGSMNLSRSPDPKAFERANYLHVLQSWREPIQGHQI